MAQFSSAYGHPQGCFTSTLGLCVQGSGLGLGSHQMLHVPSVRELLASWEGRVPQWFISLSMHQNPLAGASPEFVASRMEPENFCISNKFSMRVMWLVLDHTSRTMGQKMQRTIPLGPRESRTKKVSGMGEHLGGQRTEQQLPTERKYSAKPGGDMQGRTLWTRATGRWVWETGGQPALGLDSAKKGTGSWRPQSHRGVQS